MGTRAEAGGQTEADVVSAASDVAQILDAVCEYVRRYVVMSDAESVAVGLHAFHTHVLDAADTTPYISVTSAEMESGKTLLLETLELVVARPWLTGRVTAAVLARKVDKERPTLLLDESDAAFKGDRDTRRRCAASSTPATAGAASRRSASARAPTSATPISPPSAQR